MRRASKKAAIKILTDENIPYCKNTKHLDGQLAHLREKCDAVHYVKQRRMPCMSLAEFAAQPHPINEIRVKFKEIVNMIHPLNDYETEFEDSAVLAAIHQHTHPNGLHLEAAIDQFLRDHKLPVSRYGTLHWTDDETIRLIETVAELDRDGTIRGMCGKRRSPKVTHGWLMRLLF